MESILKITTRTHFSAFLLFCSLAACGSDDESKPGEVGDRCELGAEDAVCKTGLSCDPLAAGDGYVCGTPVTIAGTVVDALSGEVVAGGRVVALSADGSPVGDVGESDAEGAFSVVVSAPRNPDGSVAEDAKWTLNVSAQGYEAFPGGPRPAVPIFANQVSEHRVEAANTDVSLLPLADAASRPYQISASLPHRTRRALWSSPKGASFPPRAQSRVALVSLSCSMFRAARSRSRDTNVTNNSSPRRPSSNRRRFAT